VLTVTFPAKAAHSYLQLTNCNGTGLSLQDVVEMTPAFWKLHMDMLTAMDGSAINLISVGYNLFVGTVAPFLPTHPELGPIIQQALNVDVSSVAIYLNSLVQSRHLTLV
jgi:hypothetical protein